MILSARRRIATSKERRNSGKPLTPMTFIKKLTKAFTAWAARNLKLPKSSSRENVRTFSLDELFGSFKFLAAHAVKAFVSFFINVIGVTGFPEFLRSFDVAILRRADKIIKRKVEGLL